jgi:hypothetical protein
MQTEFGEGVGGICVGMSFVRTWQIAAAEPIA